jgi:uncharacterized membrane protein YebE (DUF533 family)
LRAGEVLRPSAVSGLAVLRLSYPRGILLFLSQTAQTWLTVAATLGAAILGGILAYIAAARQQSKQAKRDTRARPEQYEREDRMRLERGIAEVLAAAPDVLLAVEALPQANARRTLPRYCIRIAAMILRDSAPDPWPE